MVNSIAIVCLRLPSTATDCHQRLLSEIFDYHRLSLVAVGYFRLSWNLSDRYPLSSVIFVCILLSWTIFNSYRLLSIDLD